MTERNVPHFAKFWRCHSYISHIFHASKTHLYHFCNENVAQSHGRSDYFYNGGDPWLGLERPRSRPGPGERYSRRHARSFCLYHACAAIAPGAVAATATAARAVIASRRRAAERPPKRGDNRGLRSTNGRDGLIILPPAHQAFVELHELLALGHLGDRVLVL